MRHTVATLLLEKGENIKTIQELLGHADVSTTLNTYSHVLDRMKAATAERTNEIIGPVLPKKKPDPEKENAKIIPIFQKTKKQGKESEHIFETETSVKTSVKTKK